MIEILSRWLSRLQNGRILVALQSRTRFNVLPRLLPHSCDERTSIVARPPRNKLLVHIEQGLPKLVAEHISHLFRILTSGERIAREGVAGLVKRPPP